MPLYEVTLEQVYYGQQCINRWNYQSGEIPSGASGALLALVGMGFIEDDDTPAFDLTTIAGLLQRIQSSAVTFVQAIAKNLYSDTDFYTYAFPPATVGASGTSEGESPTTAFGFSSDRTNASIRRAQKRFAGVPEAAVAGGGIFASGTFTEMQELGDAMGQINTATFDAVTTTFTPYVFGREKYHPPGKTTWAYRYWPTEAEQLTHLAVINQFNPKNSTRTQTSRQYGRGS